MNLIYNTAQIPIRGSFPAHELYSVCQNNNRTGNFSIARDLALKAHAGVYYQPENIPYTTHLYKVVECLHKIYDGSFNLDFASSVGWLHDVVEDTPITMNDLHVLFPNQICMGVSALTKNKKLSKYEQMIDSIDRITKQPKEVALVKMADRIANLSNPHLCWSIEKKQYYLNEASLILSRLAFSGRKMAQQLEIAIKNYENKAFSLTNKVGNKVEVI